MELTAEEEEKDERRNDLVRACNRLEIPDHMHYAIVDYVVDHHPVGGFLTALLENDFMGAASRADHRNIVALDRWASLIYNHLPARCWGSPEKVSKWLEREKPDAE